MSACIASWYSVLALTTLRATLCGSCPGSTASNAVYSASQLPQYENPRQTFHTVDEDNHVVDSFLASFKYVAVPCSMGYLNVNTPRLFFHSSST